MSIVAVRHSPPAVRTARRLDDIVTILGGTKMSFYPFLTPIGTDVFPYGAGNDGLVGLPNDAAVEVEYDPIALPGGIYAYYFDSDQDNNISFADNAAYTHGNGTVDSAVSWGAWIMPTEALGTQRSIWGKHLGAAEEYDFRFDASGNLELELHDAGASATEIGTGASDVIVPFAWNFVVATYDGGQAAPEVHLYRNAVDSLAAGTTTESGTYVAMEDGAAIPMIGARNTLAAPAQEFEGYIALPFQTGKELTAANVTALHNIGRELIGL